VVWEKWIKMRIKRDCESFLENIENIITLDWMWLGEFSWERSVYVTLKKEEESRKVSCSFIIVMGNC